MVSQKNMKHVSGRKKGDVLLYALSTCVWCRKTKKLLGELGIDYHYIDVDLLDEKEKTQVEEEMGRWNPSVSFPTTVIDNKDCIVGYRPEEIREKLGS